MEKDYKEKYKAQRKYDEKTYDFKMIRLVIKKDEPEILEKLNSVPSINSYIIGLIRKDIGEDNK